MKKYIIYSIALLFASLVLSCDNDDDGGIIVSPDSDSFIQADVDGSIVKANYSVILQDREFNAFYLTDNKVKMQRYISASDNRGYFIQLERIDLENNSFPLQISYSKNIDLPSLQFVYYDINNSPSSNNQIENGDFSLTINSYTNNILVGEFEGNVYSFDPNDSTKIVSTPIQNGSFSVLLTEFEQ